MILFNILTTIKMIDDPRDDDAKRDADEDEELFNDSANDD